MVQGLAFLSKKSWHTKNLANQEKVWMAEQRKEAEAQKTRELAKQIQQEREQEELDKISGAKGSKLDRGIDWMYQGGRGELAKEDAEREAEDFLLGKEYVGEGATAGDFDGGDLDQGINNVLSNKQEESAVPETETGGANNVLANEPSVKDKNEGFRLRVEDPMFMVSQKQREKEVKYDKTKALYERVVGYHNDEENADDMKYHKKKSKKEKKRHRKQRKEKSSKRDRDYDSESEENESRSEDGDRHRYRSSRHRRSPSSDRRHRNKRQKRSRCYDRHRRSYEDGVDDSRYDRRRDRYDPSSRREEGRDGTSRGKRKYLDDQEVSARSRHSSRRFRGGSEDECGRSQRGLYDDDHRRDGYGDRDDSRRRSDDRQHMERHESSYFGKEEHTPRYSDERHSKPAAVPSPSHKNGEKKDGYGLKGGSVTVDRQNLGPNRELLQTKREEREAERRRIRETASKRRQRTDEERQRALEEMQANAKKREEARSRGGQRKDEEDYRPRSRDASFLKDITRQSHGIGDGVQSLSSRVAQNRHTNQRLHDSFL